LLKFTFQYKKLFKKNKLSKKKINVACGLNYFLLLQIMTLPIYKMSKKIKYTVEYPVRCSPAILFEFLSTSSGLQEWFADKVEDEAGVFRFSWSGAAEEAQVVEMEENKLIKFHWADSAKDEYFQFMIDRSEVTSQTILVITDFAEKKDIKDQSQLWETQVKELFHRLGS
jgi:uncharacterized protein YndB with AHSA1/START domain